MADPESSSIQKIPQEAYEAFKKSGIDPSVITVYDRSGKQINFIAPDAKIRHASAAPSALIQPEPSGVIMMRAGGEGDAKVTADYCCAWLWDPIIQRFIWFCWC